MSGLRNGNFRHILKFNTLTIVLTGSVLVAFGLSFFIFSRSTVSQFPAHLGDNLSFPIYYPTKAIAGFHYQPDSARIQAGILFYSFSDGSKNIHITEQSAPNQTLNLNSLPKSGTINMPIGPAIISTSLGNPAIVIMTPATLVELTSNKGVSKEDLAAVARNMARQN